MRGSAFAAPSRRRRDSLSGQTRQASYQTGDCCPLVRAPIRGVRERVNNINQACVSTPIERFSALELAVRHYCRAANRPALLRTSLRRDLSRIPGLCASARGSFRRDRRISRHLTAASEPTGQRLVTRCEGGRRGKWIPGAMHRSAAYDPALCPVPRAAGPMLTLAEPDDLSRKSMSATMPTTGGAGDSAGC